jgi:hypothetical protein
MITRFEIKVNHYLTLLNYIRKKKTALKSFEFQIIKAFFNCLVDVKTYILPSNKAEEIINGM